MGVSMWNTRVFDTKTGGSVLRLDREPKDLQWVDRLGAHGTGSHSFSLYDLGLTSTEARGLFEEQNRTMAVCWGDYVAYAGVLQKSNYKKNTGTLTVPHEQIRTFFKARMQFGVGAASGGDLTVTNRSASGVVRAILARAMQHSAEWTLPIDLPPDGSGGFTATWAWWRFLTIDDLFAELEDQGIEIHWRPYIHANGTLRYQTVVGQPIAIVGADLPASTPDSKVVDFEVDRDGKRVTGVIVAGQGTEAGTLTAWAGNGTGTNPIPIRDVYRAQKDIEDPARLQAIANQMYAEQKDAVEQWSFNVQFEEGELTPDLVEVGRVLRMDFRKDLWVPDGMYQRRVIALTGDLSSKVAPEVQPYGP